MRQDQYIFIHDALLEYILSGNTEVKDSAFPRYVEDLLMEKEGEEESVLESQYKVSLCSLYYYISHPYKGKIFTTMDHRVLTNSYLSLSDLE